MLTRLLPWSRPGRNGTDPWPLEMELAKIGKERITLARAVENVLVLGATGSGKSSGSGRFLASSFLRAGFGGLVLCAKSDERAVWQKYCAEAGRLDDLIIFRPDQPWRFNALDYELNRGGAGAGLTENIVNLLSAILEFAERNSSQGGGREDEGYWKRAMKQLVRNVVDLLVMAKGAISVPDLYRLVVSAPTSLEQTRSEEWKKGFCFRCLAEADRKEKTKEQQVDFEIVVDYFLLEFPGLAEKTRSIIVSTFTSMVDVLNRGLLRELFCGETNVTPRATEEGKILVVDLSVKDYSDVGQFAAAIWKYCFMRSIERRNVRQSPRPVFLWQDEAQNFTMTYDFQFVATCRSAKVATVALSQNISSFYATLGNGQQGKAMADSLFGNFNLKVFHNNGDSVTNLWAAEMIGRAKILMGNSNSSFGHGALYGGISDQSASQSAGFSEHYEYSLQPAEFTKLRTGSTVNKGIVDAILFSSGTKFQTTDKTWMRVTFQQH